MAEVGRLSANAKKMPLILSPAAYLLICDRKHCFCAYGQNRKTKNVVNARICKCMGTLFLMILSAKHFQLNKSIIKLCNKPNDIACFCFESDTSQNRVHFCPYHS